MNDSGMLMRICEELILIRKELQAIKNKEFNPEITVNREEIFKAVQKAIYDTTVKTEGSS